MGLYDHLSPERRHEMAEMLRTTVPGYLCITKRRDERTAYIEKRAHMSDEEILAESEREFKEGCKKTQRFMKTLDEAEKRSKENPSTQRYARSAA